MTAEIETPEIPEPPADAENYIWNPRLWAWVLHTCDGVCHCGE